MIEITRYIVEKVIDANGSNAVAKRLLRLITSGIELNLTWQVLFGGKEKDRNEPPTALKFNFTEHKDFRLKNIRMKGFRKFPYKDNLTYTLDFTDKDAHAPCSCFFIGGNGTGKTSIFSALQETCSDSFSAADSRGVSKKLFMPHAGVEPSKVDVIVETKDFDIDLQNPSSLISSYRKFLRPFFCSEYDIRKMTESKDITNYIISQTGYNNIHQIIDKLDEIYKEREIRLTELKEKEKNDSLSKRNNVKDTDEEQKLLECVFNNISAYKIHRVEECDIEMLRNLINLLKQEQKINIRKTDKISNKLSDILSYLEREKNMLLSCKIYVEYIKNSYSSVISQIEMLLEDISTVDNADKDEEIVGVRIPKMKTAQLGIAQRISLLNLEDLNVKRKYLADILQKLAYSIRDGETFLEFTKNYLTNLENLRSAKNISLQDTSMSEKDELNLIEINLEPLRQCKEALKNYYNAFIRSAIITTIKICETILAGFDMEGEKLEISRDKDNNNLKIEYNVNNLPMDPLLLLNSFRFKLYTLCLKISMAFSVMKNMNLSFPLVFDDVFYSSDFVNREKVRDFIEKIFKLYDEIIVDKPVPLQVIFFTHDEVVLEAAVKGMNAKDMNVMYKYGRIFNYQEMEKENISNGLCELSAIYGQSN